MDVKENGGVMPKICTDCTKGGAFAEKRDLQKCANGRIKQKKATKTLRFGGF